MIVNTYKYIYWLPLAVVEKHIVFRDQYYGIMGGSVHKSIQTSLGTYPQAKNCFWNLQELANTINTVKKKKQILKRKEE